MPITPSQLAHRRASVDFEFAGEPMHIEYYPAALSDASFRELNELNARAQALQQISEPTEADEAAGHDALLALGAWVARVLAAWDYLEDAAPDGTPGQMVPITTERVAEETNKFPDFVQACVLAAIHHYRESKTSGAVSSAPSGATSSLTVASTSSRAKRSRKPSK